MTQEEKQLLIKDLSARLPYGVKILYNGEIKEVQYIEPLYNEVKLLDSANYTIGISEIKPYLRPMENMTEEEKEEYEKLCILIPTQFDSDLQKYDYYTTDSMESFDWLLKNHFDVRDLIEKGLALEAPEGMYN